MDDTSDPSTRAMRSKARHRRRRTVEATLAHLVRVVLDEHWTAHRAAQAILEFTDHDRGVLRRVRARILRGTPAPTTPVTDQALATLDLAIAATPER
jgi:hypothetical protein